MDKAGMGGLLVVGWVAIAAYLALLIVASGVIGTVGAVAAAVQSLRRRTVRP